MPWRTLGPICALAAVMACASSSASSSPSQPRARLGKDPGRITQEEILKSRARDALQLVQELRGSFLHARGKTSVYQRTQTLPAVYVDRQYYGTIDLLYTIPSRDILEIRLYRASEAVTRFGPDKTAGVIEVITYLPPRTVDPEAGDSSQATHHHPPLESLQ